MILRCLINANRKIEREFKGRRIKFHSIVFVRDDVYSLSMQESSDYGKEMRASLDWSVKLHLITTLFATQPGTIPCRKTTGTLLAA